MPQIPPHMRILIISHSLLLCLSRPFCFFLHDTQFLKSYAGGATLFSVYLRDNMGAPATTNSTPSLKRIRQMILYFIVLLASASSWTQPNFLADGRVVPKLGGFTRNVVVEQRQIMVARTQIGSRPPRCERKCRACDHCQAVQIPISPQVQNQKRDRLPAPRITATTLYFRAKDISNYKPISWVCKCGTFFFSP